MADKKKEETSEEPKVDPKAENATETEKKAAKKPAEKKDDAKKADPKPAKKKAPAKAESADVDKKDAQGKRAEKVGIVWSDKMEKTVVVRAERLVKHRLYHKYMKRRKKFMAHNELGAAEGDRVRIVETRPLSARKRWRVAEIIQKAEK